ncbi:transcriptional coactivator/pterin dehydratase [Aspergillus recurvatus]
MNHAFRGCQHIQRSMLSFRPVCFRNYSTRQLLLSFQSPSLRASAPSIVSRQAHPRNGISIRRALTMDSEPQFAEGLDPEQLRPQLSELQDQGWRLDEGKIGIKKTFYFRSYFKAISFVNTIASQSATKKHHATMTVRIGSVDVHWTTHHPRGLTDKDISMAQFCEQAAELMGAVQEGQGQRCGPAT